MKLRKDTLLWSVSFPRHVMGWTGCMVGRPVRMSVKLFQVVQGILHSFFMNCSKWKRRRNNHRQISDTPDLKLGRPVNSASELRMMSLIIGVMALWYKPNSVNLRDDRNVRNKKLPTTSQIWHIAYGETNCEKLS